MITIVMKPVKAPVVRGEGLYECEFNRTERMCQIRARNAAEAERKFMVCCRTDLPGKLLDFDPEDYPDFDRKEKDDGKEKPGVPLHQREAEERGDPQGRKCLHEEGVRTGAGRAQLS